MRDWAEGYWWWLGDALSPLELLQGLARPLLPLCFCLQVHFPCQRLRLLS